MQFLNRVISLFGQFRECKATQIPWEEQVKVDALDTLGETLSIIDQEKIRWFIYSTQT